jgi:XTP/dITP diphosphohydrolase
VTVQAIPKQKLAIASVNPGKLKELSILLGDMFDVISMRGLGVEIEIEENGYTFEENALIKARALCSACGLASSADESGLEVRALDGKPGVRSARYAGSHGDDEANNQLLLEEMKDIDDRSARFVCAIALCRPCKPPLIARACCEGEILRERRGKGGFGYDPLFYSHDLHKAFAESSPNEKNAISHRARAVKELQKMLLYDN